MKSEIVSEIEKAQRDLSKFYDKHKDLLYIIDLDEYMEDIMTRLDDELIEAIGDEPLSDTDDEARFQFNTSRGLS